jgi:tetratricopeptide (TPR) repeat protein
MENLIRKDDENLQVVYEHYKTNLEDITRTIRKKGTQVILCSVGSNLKDSAPFVSLHRADITDDEKEKWENLYHNGEKYENSGKHDQALQSYLAAADIDSDYADLHFRIARAYWQLGNFEKARNEYILARETDTLRLRADNRINQIIREVADNNKGKGVWFVDSVKAFEQNSPNSTIGQELFYEYVHMNFKGNYILANAVFRQVEKILPPKIKNKRADVPVLTEM